MNDIIIEAIGYVPLEAWCKFEGTTTRAIHIRLARGHWQHGVHVVKPPGGKMMVNLEAARKWLTENSRAA